MKRFSFAILVAFVHITNLYAYEPLSPSVNPSMVRLLPSTNGASLGGLSNLDAPRYVNRQASGSFLQEGQIPTSVAYRTPAPASYYPQVAKAGLIVEPIPGVKSEGGQLVSSSSFTPRFQCRDLWHLQVLPDGLLYRPYMASAHECRIAGQWVEDQNLGCIWDVALGGRVGILRYGNNSESQPEGWQADMEGAAFPRLQLNSDLDVISCDYKFGVPFSYARGRHATKFGYYHLSSHLGDEYLIKHPWTRRINYSRDCLLLGHSIYFHHRKMRVYAEAAWAFQTGDMTKPWEFQFGFEYAPSRATGFRPQPFFAIGGHLREEVDFGGNMIIQAGYLWRGATGHMFRMGLQYYVGMSDQYEFIDQYENKVGFGIWYDF